MTTREINNSNLKAHVKGSGAWATIDWKQESNLLVKGSNLGVVKVHAYRGTLIFEFRTSRIIIYVPRILLRDPRVLVEINGERRLDPQTKYYKI